MQEEENLRVEATEAEMDADSYIEALNSMKQNSVSKDEYLKLKAENRKLLNSLANGEYTQQESKKESVDINELRNSLFNSENSNLEYVSRALQLRNVIIENGGQDPFVPSGPKYIPTEDDFNCANRVAQIFQECVDYADGDDQVFTNELMRRTIDSSPMMGRRNR